MFQVSKALISNVLPYIFYIHVGIDLLIPRR